MREIVELPRSKLRGIERKIFSTTGIVGWVEARSADTHRWGMMGIADAQPILRRNRKAASCWKLNDPRLEADKKLFPLHHVFVGERLSMTLVKIFF